MKELSSDVKIEGGLNSTCTCSGDVKDDLRRVTCGNLMTKMNALRMKRLISL